MEQEKLVLKTNRLLITKTSCSKRYPAEITIEHTWIPQYEYDTFMYSTSKIVASTEQGAVSWNTIEMRLTDDILFVLNSPLELAD